MKNVKICLDHQSFLCKPSDEIAEQIGKRISKHVKQLTPASIRSAALSATGSVPTAPPVSMVRIFYPRSNPNLTRQSGFPTIRNATIRQMRSSRTLRKNSAVRQTTMIFAHIINAQTSVGKTEIYLEYMTNAQGRVLIAVPTNVLKHDVLRRARKLGIHVMETPSLDEIQDDIPTPRFGSTSRNCGSQADTAKSIPTSKRCCSQRTIVIQATTCRKLRSSKPLTVMLSPPTSCCCT